MLISCPECNLQVSDKALSCPHCGYPLKPSAIKRRAKRNHRRLPNGFGQISKLPGNLKKPYRAMVTIGTKGNGRPRVTTLKPEGYFRTYNEAYEALLKYNKNPYDLSKDDLTIEELYEKWLKEKAPELKKPQSLNRDISSFKYAAPIYKVKVRDLRKYQVKELLSNAEVDGKKISPVVSITLRGLLNQMMDFAVEEDLVDRNIVRDISVQAYTKRAAENRRSHLSFTSDEMIKLWNNSSDPFVRVILIGCYTGFRPNELVGLKIEDIDLNENIMRGGSKTKAGLNRIVPVHDRIFQFIKDFYDESVAIGSEYLFSFNHSKRTSHLQYEVYKLRFHMICDRLHLNPEHSAHDTRVQFVTMCKKYNVDEYAIKYMVGHSIKDLTERVYTKREISWLQTELKKIK